MAHHIVSNITKAAAGALHPYSPPHISITNYSANKWGVPALLTVFFGSCFLLVAATHYTARTLQPKLSRTELWTTDWLVLSGCIHLIFEGYYARNFDTLGGDQSLLGQLWKEYAFSDSRYLTRDAFVLCMESVTAFLWGPGCLLAAGMVVARHPARYAVQGIVSLGQFYGDVLYYSTCAFDHWVYQYSYSRPERFYFWFYFMFMNFLWIMIPGYLIYESFVVSTSAIRAAQKNNSLKKAL